MRTVVLPQGKFSEFLKVSGKDRRRNLRAPLSSGGVWCVVWRSASPLQSKKSSQRHTRLCGQAEVYGDCSRRAKICTGAKSNYQTEIELLEKALRERRKEAEIYKEIWNLKKNSRY